MKIYPFKDQPDQLLLFSTKHASKILIPEEIFQSIENGTISDSDAALLQDLGMLVPDAEDEKQAMLHYMDEMNRNNRLLHLTVVLNLDCNFACPYCFEEGMKGKLYLSDNTEKLLVKFIKKQLVNKERLLIDFYGGEPMLSFDRMKSISETLLPYSKKQGLFFSSGMVTNGSLFTRKKAEELVRLGLKNIKITIDGPPEIHNKSRPFKSGAKSFDVIIDNIKKTCDIVVISIGGNYRQDNYKKFVLLLDYLLSEGLGPDKIYSVKFDPIMDLPSNSSRMTGIKNECGSTNDPWVLKADSFLREEIFKRGWFPPKPAPMSCMIESKYSYVVNFDRTIYKCPTLNGKKEFEAGDLETGIKDYAESYNLSLWKDSECLECRYLPLCFGGCRYISFLKNGNVKNKDCKK
ncbi:MAG: geopeptide radical SAM maturase, partial [Desulfosarcina sp.]|nr:geopeptide radical SAM maturase [Desulfobacterales bacterium]